MISINLQRNSVLTALVTCSIRAEQQQAFIDHISHFLARDTQLPVCLSVVFLPPPSQQPTSRELDVLKLIVEGYSNREIAQHLNVSQNTVKTHVRGLMNKFGVDRRIQLVAIAMAFNSANNFSTTLNAV